MGCLYSLDCTVGLDYWTRLNCHKMPFSGRGQAKYAYSAYYLAKQVSLTCGQRLEFHNIAFLIFSIKG